MLAKRIISSAALIIFIALATLLDWMCALVITAFIITGLYEFFTMIERKGINIYKYVGIGLGAIIPLSIALRFELTRGWELFFVLLAMLFLTTMQFRRRSSSGAIVGISTTVFGVLYISWFLSFFIKIRYLPQGLGLFAMVLLIVKLGDIGAYLIGSRFGKTPLMPRISPKKSVEGSIGGLVFSILVALASKPMVDLSYMHLLFIGVSFGVLGQLGDLSESLMKRDCEVKDAGAIFPGLGGVLDVVDSLLFVGPAFYFYMSVILAKQ
jgi:phosphatidate cytidylyltransferase